MVAEQDWVLVTNNAIEFRGRNRDIELHPGVVFLLPAVRRAEQVQLFEAALDYIRTNPDMINGALDVSFGSDCGTMVAAYALREGLPLRYALSGSCWLMGASLP